MQENQIITDPLYGKVSLTEFEKQIIITREFNRLRRIRQLSFGYVMYFSANHTRFEHSIGTRYICKKMMNHLIENREIKINPQTLEMTLLAALLHDIGHPAFSHAAEDAIKRATNCKNTLNNHEKATELIITEDSQINRLLKEKYKDELVIKKISDIATGNLDDLSYKEKFLADIVAGEFGCDRIDYLRRDSYYTGTAYGFIEIPDLINKLKIIKFPQQNRLGIDLDHSRGGIDALSFLLLSRSYHFGRIVHQPQIRVSNALFTRLLQNHIENITENIEKFVKDIFLKHDDYTLMTELLNTMSNPKKNLLENLWKGQQFGIKENDNLIFKRLDDFSPEFRFYLTIINLFRYDSIYEDKIQQKLQKEGKNIHTILVDLNVNGQRGIPSHIFVDSSTEYYYSCLAFDKSPLLNELATTLARTGSLSVYYNGKSTKIPFASYFSDAEEIVDKIRKESPISPELLLITIFLGREYYNTEDHCMISPGIPGIARLMENCKKICDFVMKDYGIRLWSNTSHSAFSLIGKINPFYWNSYLLKELFLLQGIQFIYIMKKPIGTDANSEFHKKLWKYNDITEAMTDRWDIVLSYDGIYYSKKLLAKKDTHELYEKWKYYIKELEWDFIP